MRLSAVRCVQAAKMTARTNNTGHKKGVTLRPYVTLHPEMTHLARGPSSVSGEGRHFRLKILHVVGTPGHGSGRQVINLAENMRDLGHELHIIYSGTRISPDFRCQLDGLSNVQRCDVAMSRNPHPADLKSTFRIRSYIYRNGPFDVVHGHSSKAGALARVAAIGSGAVRVYTPHAFVTMDPLLQRGERHVYRRVEQILGRVSDGIIVVSDEERCEGISLGIPEQRLFVIPPAISCPAGPARQIVRRTLGIEDHDICVGFVGRFVRQKAGDRLVRAFAIAAQRDAKLRLLMIGDGDARDQLHAEAERLELGRKVIWTGEIRSAEAFRAIDIFVQPSRYEGLSGSTAEAIALGIPVVATACGGMSSLVEHGVNGFIVPQSSEDEIAVSLAHAIAALATDEPLRRRMGRASLEKSAAFDPGRVTREILELYAKLAMEKRHKRIDRRVFAQSSVRRDLDPPCKPAQDAVTSQALSVDHQCTQGRNAPLISAITVTLNAGKTLERTIDSVQRQTHLAVEHIIVDGGSMDETLDIIKARLRPGDRWISEEDRGISDAFNKGIALARGEYVQIINADDWLSPDQLAYAVDVLNRTGADFAFGDCICYQNGKPSFRYCGDPNYGSSITKRMPPMNHPSMLVRRSAYQRFGCYSPEYGNAMDYDWLARAHSCGARGAYDPRIIAHMSIEGRSVRLFTQTAREVRRIAVEHGRNPAMAALEYRYRVVKTALSKPVLRSCKPLYDVVRSTINPAYRPLR
jgi:glycosyltransferase involved in cell wall biosynthesis